MEVACCCPICFSPSNVASLCVRAAQPAQRLWRAAVWWTLASHVAASSSSCRDRSRQGAIIASAASNNESRQMAYYLIPEGWPDPAACIQCLQPLSYLCRHANLQIVKASSLAKAAAESWSHLKCRLAALNTLQLQQLTPWQGSAAQAICLLTADHCAELQWILRKSLHRGRSGWHRKHGLQHANDGLHARTLLCTNPKMDAALPHHSCEQKLCCHKSGMLPPDCGAPKAHRLAGLWL